VHSIKIFVLAVVMFSFSTLAYAAPVLSTDPDVSGLLGKKNEIERFPSGIVTSNLYSNNKLRFYMEKDNAIKWDLGNVYDITHVMSYSDFSADVLTTGVYFAFYDKNDQLVKEIRITKEIAETVDFKRVDVKGVRYVKLYNTGPQTFRITYMNVRGIRSGLVPDYQLKSDVVEAESITLSWKAQQDADKYYIYRDDVLIAESINTSYIDLKLKPDRDYKYQVSFVGFGTEYPKSVPLLLHTPTKPPPNAPKGLYASMTADMLSIKLNWQRNKETDVKEYAIYQIAKDGTKTYLDRTNQAEYFITSFNESTEYSYMIRAINTAGIESKDSNIASITTPSKNTTTTTQPGNNFLLVKWTEVPGAVAYEISYNSKVVAKVPAKPPYEFKLTAAHGYDPNRAFHDVKVRAVFANGSTGGTGGSGSSNNYGFDPADIIKTTMYIVASLASFILLWLVIHFAPRIISVLRRAVIYVRREWIK